MKIVTCEETAELNMPTENWVRFVTRESYGLGTQKMGEITLYDLVKTSLRYRPDYLIVGEVRGEEAFVLFQAIATGHGGLSTIHAESIESVMKRLVSPPMNIPASHIPLLDAVTLVERVRLPRSTEGRTYGRRIRYIWEVVDYNRYVTVAEWDPATDTFREDFMNSIVLEKIAARSAKSKEEMIMEIERRAELLKRMVERNLLEIRDIAREVYAYYSDPEQVLRKYGVTPMLVPAVAPAEKPEEKPVAEATKAIKQDAEGGEDAIAEAILRILEANNGEYPLWKIFVELETSKIAVFKALKRLRESGVIEMSQSMVRLTGS